ncbi:MAG: MinD/ParA family protein [Phycisphaerae bacterium]|nr:MinD/ParA family protein [Phycisphaerae bacterium]
MTKGIVDFKEAVANQAKAAKVIAVTSGKGGVGKTNISVNLATCLKACGKKVLLFDADLSLGNLDILLNTTSRYNISHLLSGKKNLDQVIHTTENGIDIICGCSGMAEMADLTQFQRHRLINDLNSIANNNDVIIVDTGAGICKDVMAFCMFSDELLLVTTPEATAMTDAYAMIKVLAKNGYGGSINLVVNMAADIAEGKKTYQQIAGVAMRFLDTAVYSAGILLRDNSLIESVRQRKPVVLAYPKSKISQGFISLAAKVTKDTVSSNSQNGFFKKVVDWFF